MSFFKRILGALRRYDKVDLSNNINTKITNNRINSPNIISYLDNGESDSVSIPSSILPLIDEKSVVEGTHERAENNITIFDKLLYMSKQSGEKQVIRMYGLFTSLSILESKSNRSPSYEELLKLEKEYIELFIKQGFEVKICASLDLPYIYEQWGYAEEELALRVSNLCQNISLLSEKYSNLNFTIDTHNRLDGHFILGSSLLIKSIRVTTGKGYSQTVYDNNQVIVSNAIQTFDDVFYSAKRRELGARKLLKIERDEDYISTVIESRIKFLID
ncbi:hypothetical protein [Pseudoalteromonas sp. OOF1S-7]|uniref:hypothetical protein n=1 Tax=Pseudoalteromonas sp. OOF1S-7 TaxID=2917757 RepID=UPI001EF5DA42|nr:hypothetical protein [Pseudoalteromonas sp. OOF1S-7]MCG7534975.1 hypothetical protein [Pseudoalteromonas sp. OOF1S-7]